MQRFVLFAVVVISGFVSAGCVSAVPNGSRRATEPAASNAPRQTTALGVLNAPGSVRGRAVFVGVARRRRDRDEELGFALRHAAEQAARFVGLSATYRVVAQSAGGDRSVVDRIDTLWDEALAETLLERAQLLNVVATADATYARVAFAGLHAPPLGSVDSALDRSGVPRWALDPPRIDGYLVGVGIALRGSTVRRSVDRADENALQDIVQQVETSVRLVEADQAIGRVGTRNLATTALSSRARLAGFYVAARYIDTDARYAYSLALARVVAR